MKLLSKSPKETEKIAKEFVKDILKKKHNGAIIVGLSGNLGAGKTAFVKAVAKSLGVTDTVQSPTFVIEKIYKIKTENFEHLIHIDAYRLESAEELLKLGFKEIAENPKNIIFIEWPEKVKGILPKDAALIYFTHINDKEREITIK